MPLTIDSNSCSYHPNPTHADGEPLKIKAISSGLNRENGCRCRTFSILEASKPAVAPPPGKEGQRRAAAPLLLIKFAKSYRNRWVK